MTKLAPVAQATKQLITGALRSARLKVAHILVDHNQPRKNFDQEKYNETRASVKAIGLQVPITVNPGPIRDGIQYYYTKYGENRWRIHVDLKLEEIDCVIDPEPYSGEFNVLRVLTQAAENINRIDHTHGEIAAVYALFFEDAKQKNPGRLVADIQGEFGTIFGKSEMWVQNYAAMSNLRSEFLARVDVKGPTQIPFMAAVALGRNPKERQTSVLHGAELIAGSRRDLLYRYTLQETNRLKKLNGERIGHHQAAGNKRAFANIPKNVQRALGQFGAGMRALDRESYMRRAVEEMSGQELSAMVGEVNATLESLQAIKNLVQTRLGAVSKEAPPATVISTEDADEEEGTGGTQEPRSTSPHSIWPGLATVEDVKLNGAGAPTHRYAGKRY